jgi:hypothetical protein
MTYSLRAQKARREAAIRAGDWQPSVARTQTKAIVQRRSGGRQRQRGFAEWVKVNLPTYTYNSKRGWWEAPLEELEAAVDTLGRCNLSQGAKEYLEAVLAERYSYWRDWLNRLAEQLDARDWFGALLARKVAKASGAEYAKLRWGELETLAGRYPSLAEKLEWVAYEMQAELMGASQ